MHTLDDAQKLVLLVQTDNNDVFVPRICLLQVSYLEDGFLKGLGVTRDDLEPLADGCTEVRGVRSGISFYIHILFVCG